MKLSKLSYEVRITKCYRSQTYPFRILKMSNSNKPLLKESRIVPTILATHKSDKATTMRGKIVKTK